MTEISIIVRTKNEERWISHCLEMLYRQDFKDFEVILVDNQSTDNTVLAASRYPLAATVHIEHYKPGFALNEGIRASKGKYIVCLSAHCIPKSATWLSTLYAGITADEKFAGVYGRQLPVSFTSAVDKRDLLIVFGLDRRVQVKDYFFHNANSILRRDLWERFPFDEDATNIEDRIWGKQVIDAGYQIVYDPDAPVYHHHGLHQGNNPERAKGVVSIIEKVDVDQELNDLPDTLRPDQATISAVVPVSKSPTAGSYEYQLFEKTIEDLKSSEYVNQIYLVSHEKDLANNHGVHWLGRDTIEDCDNLSLESLMQVVLDQIESSEVFPEALLYVNYDYLHRPKGIFDKLIEESQYKGYDTVFAGLMDYHHYWVKDGLGDFKPTETSLASRDKRDPVYRALYGLGCVMSSWTVRTAQMIGGTIGIHAIEDPRLALRLQDIDGLNSEIKTLRALVANG